MNRSDREADRAMLLTRIAAYPAAAVPCRAGALPAAYWTSDDPDEQDRAAAACAGCPAWESCAEFIEGHPDEAGTYGGATESWRQLLRGIRGARIMAGQARATARHASAEPAAPTRTPGRPAATSHGAHADAQGVPRSAARAGARAGAHPAATSWSGGRVAVPMEWGARRRTSCIGGRVAVPHAWGARRRTSCSTP